MSSFVHVADAMLPAGAVLEQFPGGSIRPNSPAEYSSLPVAAGEAPVTAGRIEFEPEACAAVRV